MPVRSVICIALALAAISAGAAVGAAEPDPKKAEAAKLIEEMFGKQLKEAAATRPIDDDAEIAGQMIQAALRTADQPMVLVAVCERIADELGTRSGGHETAIRALSLLALRQPERRTEVLERMLEVRKHEATVARGSDRRSALGGQVAVTVALAETRLDDGRTDEGIKLYQEAQLLARRIGMKGTVLAVGGVLDDMQPLIERLRVADQLKAKLKTNPDDKDAARQLVHLYLLDFDDPAEARKFAFLVGDGDLEAKIKLAGRPVGELSETDALALADWYAALPGPDASVLARRAAHQRLIACLERFLVLHTASDLHRTKAEIRIGQARAALADLAKP